MIQAKHRTSFALDEMTLRRLRQLSRTWDVSQAEAVRRAVEMTFDHVQAQAGEVRERLVEYRAAGHVAPDEADTYLGEVAEDRADWGRER
jgi:hypothetical protein